MSNDGFPDIKKVLMPTHKSVREIISNCLSDMSYVILPDDEVYIDQAIASLAELVRGEKKEIEDIGSDMMETESPITRKVYEDIKWNSALEHIARLIEGKQGKGE